MKIHYYLLSILLLCTACEEPKVTKTELVDPPTKTTLPEVEPTIFQKGQWADRSTVELMQLGELPATYLPIRFQTTKDRHTYQLVMTEQKSTKMEILQTRTDLYSAKEGYAMTGEEGATKAYLDFEKSEAGNDLLICDYSKSQDPFYRKGKTIYTEIPLAVENVPQKYYAEGYYHVFDTAQNLVADEVILLGNGTVQNFEPYKTFQMSNYWEDTPLLSLQDTIVQSSHFVLEDTDTGFDLYELKNLDIVEEIYPKGAQKGRRMWTFKRMKMYED
ncbi:MAG: hypothetical protein GY810_03845 [Aureispira sp.]|nr:hypothetical protein [Aureispira sp.]